MCKERKDAGFTNVVFILSDDQGQWAAGCYGNPEIRTPNIDRLAESGMRFDNFFCSSPVCSPSRATFFTGHIPSQHGVHDWIRDGNIPPGAKGYLDNEICYTDILAEYGYTCGISGKWHLGDSVRVQHGFSHWFVHQQGGGPYYNAPMVRDGRLVNEPGYVTDVITRDALRFLDENHDRPFYLSVHYTAPHSPWIGQHPKAVVDSYDGCRFESCPQESRHPWAGSLSDNLGNREALKGYFAAVTAMDADIGRILDRLEELGLRERTLVVFTSDNGFSCGQHGFWGKGNGTFPLNMYDSSVKIPAVFSHPGRIPAKSSTDALVSAYDFMPTLLDYLNLPLPADLNLPGGSRTGVLTGESDEGAGSVVVYDEYGPVRMLRTREWKYVHRYPYGPHELYNLVDDPGERENLAGDTNQRARVDEMRAMLSEWFSNYVEPDKDGIRHGITGSGQRDIVGSDKCGAACFY